MQGIHRWPVNSPHKGSVTRNLVPFDKVIMFKRFEPISELIAGLSKKKIAFIEQCAFDFEIYYLYPYKPSHAAIYIVKYNTQNATLTAIIGGWEWHMYMMTSWNGKIFRVIGPLWGEAFGHWWIPITEASHAELSCFLWSAPERRVGQTIGATVIWEAITLIMTSM